VTSSSPGSELRRLRALVGDLDAVVWEADASSGRLTFVSEGAAGLLGYPASAFVEQPTFWADHIHPDDRERAVSAFLAGTERAEAHDMEYRFLHRDGNVVWVRDIGHTVTDLDGCPLSIRGLMVDVTRQKFDEERRAELEQRHRRLVEQLPGMVYLESVEPYDAVPGRLLYISPQLQSVLGFSPSEWTDDPVAWKTRLHRDDVDALRAAYREAMASDASFRADYRMLARDGDIVWIHAEAMLVRDDDGTPQFWQGVMFDATEQTRAELQLREAEERYRALVEQTPAVTYIDDLDSPRTLYISPQVERLLGYPASEFTGAEPLWPWILHPDDRDRMLERSDRADASRQAFNEEYRLVAKDGHIVWVHDQAVLIRDEGGDPKYWQGVWVDITERKRALELERALEVEREEASELRALDEMKNTFLQAVSHDLRTPLAAILGLAVTIEKQKVGGDEAASLSGRIAANARKLDRMVTDLLDMDRLSRGIVEPKLQVTDVGALVARVVDEAEVISGRDVTIEVEEVLAEVDVAKLERIIENLLVNAVRHTPPDASIWVFVRPEDGGVEIVVEDDGPGVAAEHREEIFQPFRQADSPSAAASPGVGIGLALVSRFSELHHGHAWVQEREGGGASFHVWLPAGDAIENATTA
jgi:PAS domain S-box-containing protein